MRHNESRNPFEAMFFVYTEFDYLVVARKQRKVRKTTVYNKAKVSWTLK